MEPGRDTGCDTAAMPREVSLGGEKARDAHGRLEMRAARRILRRSIARAIAFASEPETEGRFASNLAIGIIASLLPLDRRA